MGADRNVNYDNLDEKHNSRIFDYRLISTSTGGAIRSIPLVSNSDEIQRIGLVENNGHKSNKVDGQLWRNDVSLQQAHIRVIFR